MGLLRVLLAYSVIIAHTDPISGFVGLRDHAVTAFFIISGFYMQLIMENKYDNRNGLSRFYINRALRILPSYWVFLLLVIFFAVCKGTNIELIERMHQQSADSIRRATDGSAASFLTAFSNLFIIGADTARIFCISQTTGHIIVQYNNTSCNSTFYYEILPPAWSLSNELIFYIVSPFFARMDKRSILLSMIAIDKFNDTTSYFHFGAANLLFWYNIFYFLLGMLACKFYQQNRVMSAKALTILALFPFVVWALYPQIEAQLHSNDQFKLLWIIFAFGIAILFDKTRNWRWDRMIGDWSYSIYLIHWLFAYPMWMYGSYSAVGTIIVSTLSAALMSFAVERPINKLRRRLSVKKIAVPIKATVEMGVAPTAS